MQPMEAFMTATPPIPTDAEQEEAKRQAQSSGSGFGDALDGAEAATEIAAEGGLDLVLDAASACIDVTTSVATTSIELIGGLLGGIVDL